MSLREQQMPFLLTPDNKLNRSVKTFVLKSIGEAAMRWIIEIVNSGLEIVSACLDSAFRCHILPKAMIWTDEPLVKLARFIHDPIAEFVSESIFGGDGGDGDGH